MKRSLVMCAVSALVVGASVPAAAFSTTPTTTPVLASAHRPTADAQVFSASNTPLAPVARDAFAVEKIVEQTLVAFSQITGSLAMWPASGGVNDGFGYRDGGEFHKGIDIMAGAGSAIVAASPGVVSAVSFDGGWGQYVRIDHGGGVETLYAHMIEGSPTVSVGQLVNAGDLLGSVGSTGYVTVAHLHFEVYVGGSPVDPMGWLP
jgi:murein DD-endopeptidase MepM/ murein hydrolase activator NlpD